MPAKPTKKTLGALIEAMNNRLQTEVIKAHIATFCMSNGEEWNKLSGTSFSTNVYSPKLPLNSVPVRCGLDRLAESIGKEWFKATQFINSSIAEIPPPKNSFQINPPIFYAVEISPKTIAWSIGSLVSMKQIGRLGVKTFNDIQKLNDNTLSDLLNYCREQTGLPLTLDCLLMGDMTHLSYDEPSLVLPPQNMNELLVELVKRTRQYLGTQSLQQDFNTNMEAPALILSSDTDSPHRKMVSTQKSLFAPVFFTPGIILVGSTGDPQDFDGFHLFRLGLIANIIRGNSLSSQINKYARPFTFFGAGFFHSYGLDVNILPRLGQLRYSGNIDETREFSAIDDKLFTLTFGSEGKESREN